MEALRKSLTIRNKKGLHVRAATVLANTAGRFRSGITIEYGGERVNAKSVVNLPLLSASQGSEVNVSAEGEDAAEALNALTEIFEAGFGE